MKWISVEDRLPDHDKKLYSVGVEVLVHGGVSGTAYYGKRINAISQFYKYGAPVDGITHWMPLPPCPEKDDDDS